MGFSHYEMDKDLNNSLLFSVIVLLADRVGVRLPELEASKEEKRAADLRSRLLEVQKQAIFA